MTGMQRVERLDRGIKARADDVYVLDSLRAMLYLAAPKVLPFVVLFLLPLVLPPYWQRVLLYTSVFVLLAISWTFLYSFVGMISLGQSLFVGVGAYLAGLLNTGWGWPIGATLPVSALIGALLCTLLLLPALRLRGIYFAMTTLVLPLLLVRVIEALDLFGGTDGLTGVAPLPGIWVASYSAIVAICIALLAFGRLVSSDFGMVLQGIRDNDQAVRSVGISVPVYKALALFLAALPGTLAGAFLAHLYRFVGLSSFALDFSVLPIAASVVGGLGSLAGPALGAFLLVPLSEALRALGSLRIVFYALLVVIFVALRPEGIFNYLKRKYHQFERRVQV